MFLRVKVHVGLYEAEIDVRDDILNTDYIVKVEASDKPNICRVLYNFSDSEGAQEILVDGSLDALCDLLSAKELS